MKRDLDTVMYMPDMKTPMTFGNSTAPLTAGQMISEATISMFPDEQPRPNALEKSMRFKLSLRCGLGGEQAFSKQEMACILRCCDMKCGTWLYGQMVAWADGVKPFMATLASIGNEDDNEDPLDVMAAHEDTEAA